MQDKREERTLTAMENRLRQEGFKADFNVVDGHLTTIETANGTPRAWKADDVRIVDFYRFEGESNPDDMSILYAIETVDGTKGTISNAYGTYADADTDSFILEVENLGKDLDKAVK